MNHHWWFNAVGSVWGLSMTLSVNSICNDHVTNPMTEHGGLDFSRTRKSCGSPCMARFPAKLGQSCGGRSISLFYYIVDRERLAHCQRISNEYYSLAESNFSTPAKFSYEWAPINFPAKLVFIFLSLWPLCRRSPLARSCSESSAGSPLIHTPITHLSHSVQVAAVIEPKCTTLHLSVGCADDLSCPHTSDTSDSSPHNSHPDEVRQAPYSV